MDSVAPVVERRRPKFDLTNRLFQAQIGLIRKENNTGEDKSNLQSSERVKTSDNEAEIKATSQPSNSVYSVGKQNAEISKQSYNVTKTAPTHYSASKGNVERKFSESDIMNDIGRTSFLDRLSEPKYDYQRKPNYTDRKHFKSETKYSNQGKQNYIDRKHFKSQSKYGIQREPNFIDRKHCKSETKDDIEVEVSKDCIEFSGVTHEDLFETSSIGLKKSFKNESLSKSLPSSTGMPPVPSDPCVSPTSPVPSFASTSPISNLVFPSPATDLASTSPVKVFTSPINDLASTSPISNLASTSPISNLASTSPISNLASTSPVNNLVPTSPINNLVPTSPIVNLTPTSPDSTISTSFSIPNLSSSLPVSSIDDTTANINSSFVYISPPICQSHTSNIFLNDSDYNNAHILLSSEEDCFIPPPVIPSVINDSDSSASVEKQVSSLNGSKLNLEALEDDDLYPSVSDPDHLKAVTKYITTVVEERKVDNSVATNVVRDLNLLFKDHFEGNVIDCYGSYETGLAISTSDINIVVRANVSIRKSFMYEIYKILSSELERYHVYPFEEGNGISAHQTKINFFHSKMGINCQLAYLGKYEKNIFKMGQYLKFVTRMDERVKMLILATKIWAEILVINEVEDGKLHPIGYVLLVIHFLQHCDNPILPVLSVESCDDKEDIDTFSNTATVGELWLDFLKYYSIKFNWKQDVITVTSRKCVSKKSKNWETYWMAIEDPFTGKNIAQSVINSDVADYIQSCFKSSYAYFCNPPESISSTDENDENNGESSGCKYEFSFQQCVVEQSDAHCETCEEIDDLCSDCAKKIYVQPMAAVPKMTDTFLSVIKNALMTVYDKYVLSEEEVNERKQFVMKLQKEVCKVCPDAQLNLFGSSTNGFGFKNSDLDINITSETQQINSSTLLKNIRQILRKDRDFGHVVAIFNAQIPIIKFHYLPRGWRGDISLDNTLAVHNSELLYTYSLMDERCKILGCAFKLLAKKALVSEVTDKALSSYSYLNMVIHFLQQTEPPVLPVLQDNKFRGNNFSLDHIVESCNVWFCKDLSCIEKIFKMENTTSVEQLWLDLLDYYCSFDTNKLITIRQKEIHYGNDLQRSSRLFNIQDPFIETKNLGGVVSSKKAQETQSVLNRARQLFRTPVKELPSGLKDIEDYFFSTMSLTGRIHKEALCDLCGKFGHERSECKQTYFPLHRPNFRRFQQFKWNQNRNRNTATYKKPFNKPLYRKQVSV